MYVDGTLNVPSFRHFRRRNNLHCRAIISTNLNNLRMRSIWTPLLRSEKLSPRPPTYLHHPDPSSAPPSEGTWQLPIS
ncbi:MAG: hypothetical protein ACTS53_02120 [Candidatus Hodgkinia cicadicola]